MGARTKYAFINNSEGGVSLSSTIGLGTGMIDNRYFRAFKPGPYGYADMTTSYLLEWFEPYFVFRGVLVWTEDFQETGFDKYAMAILGTRLWMNKNAFLSIEIFGLAELHPDGFFGYLLPVSLVSFGYKF